MKYSHTISLFFRKPRPGFFSIEQVFQTILPELKKKTDSKPIYLNHSGGNPLTLIKNIRYARRQKSRVNHITGDTHYLVLAFPKKSILTIHDIGSAFTGNILRDLYLKLFWLWLPVWCARRITVISQTSANEVISLVPWAKHKIRVIHNAVNPAFKYSSQNFNAIKPVILHLGTKQNKNLERTIEALHGLKCKLIVIGKLSDNQHQLLKKNTIDFENKQNLSQEAIIEAYMQCDIVSFPTLYEGFGMPVIEAQSIGRPVVAGNIPVIREISGDAVCFVDPYSVDSIRAGFQKIMNDAQLRKTLVENGLQNIQRFSPEFIAKEYLKVYQEISDNNEF